MKRKRRSATASEKTARSIAATTFAATSKVKVRLNPGSTKAAWLEFGPLWLKSNTKADSKVLNAKKLAKAAYKRFIGK